MDPVMSPTPSLVRKQIKSTPKKRPWVRTSGATPQRIPATNLNKMHEDTMKVLTNINENIAKMANSQERLVEAIERLINKLPI